MHDLVIRGGTVADGAGRPLVEADVAVEDAGSSPSGTSHLWARRRSTPAARSTAPAELLEHSATVLGLGDGGPTCR